MAIEGGRTGITLDAVLDIAYLLGVDVTWLFSDNWTLPEDADHAPGAPPVQAPSAAPPERHGNSIDGQLHKQTGGARRVSARPL